MKTFAAPGNVPPLASILVPRRDGKPGQEYQPLWYEKIIVKLCDEKENWKDYKSRWRLIQQARMVRLAMSLQKTYEDDIGTVVDNCKAEKIKLILAVEKIPILDAVALNNDPSWRNYGSSILLSRDEKGQSIPFPVPVVHLPSGYKQLSDLDLNLSERQICSVLMKVVEHLLFSVRMKVSPSIIPLNRILLTEVDQHSCVYLACADLAVGPLTIEDWSLSNDPEPIHALLNAFESLLQEVADRFKFGRLRTLVSTCQGHAEKAIFDSDAYLVTSSLLALDTYQAALAKEARTQRGPALYLDSANIERRGLLRTDLAVRWGRFMRGLRRDFPDLAKTAFENLYANRRTGDSKRFRKFFGSLRQFQAVIDRAAGKEPGDQADDKRLEARVIQDIAKQNATSAFVITGDEGLLASIRNQIGAGNIVSLDPANPRVQALFRECSI